MTAVLNKPADRIDVGDIQALIDECVPESAQIEFKESLPAGKGKTDAWLNGGSGIGDYARNRILEEVVAFANAYGGALVLGIAEDGAKPPVAATVEPLPRCADLAERLRLVFRDCVEPQLPTLEVVPVPTNGDDGVVVFRTGRSSRGPHRVTPTLVCPIRRADRRDSMSMREIQDMTLNLARGTERLERRLRERAEKFEGEFQLLETYNDAFGFRMTGVPVNDDVLLESVYSGHQIINELRPPSVEVQRTLNGKRRRLPTIANKYQLHFSDWRPMLRATRSEDCRRQRSRKKRCTYCEIHSDGLLEIGFFADRLIRDPSDRKHEFFLDAEIPVATFASLLVWAERVRQYTSVPGAEFVIQVQFKITATAVRVEGSDDSQIGIAGEIKRSDTFFPAYNLELTSEFQYLVSQFEKDYWNLSGKDIGSRQGIFDIVQV